MRGSRLRWGLTALAAAIVLGLCLVGAYGVFSRNGPGPSPFAGRSLYVDPESPAAEAVADASDPATKAALQRIADQPAADWFGDWNATADVRALVAERVATSTAVDALPVLVVYAIPLRDCTSYSAGGMPSAEDYRSWVDEFAAGIGTFEAVVILEPDALAQLDCLTTEEQTTRLELLRYAVERLGESPNVSTYLDAGNSDWVTPELMADRLTDAGLADARGFALNISGFGWTQDEVDYGQKVAALTGGKPFVIDTSRNGAGPLGSDQWCNPPGRALGVTPLSAPPDELVDALLWIKVPGESDGDCGRGEPEAGVFWPEYAASLAWEAE